MIEQKWFVLTLLLVFLSCKESDDTYSEKTLQELQVDNISKKDICLVLYNDTNKVYQTFKHKLNSEYSQLKKQALFNFIDISKKENIWFKHWLCLNSSVMTCVFTNSGNLRALIGGASTYSFNHLQEILDNKAKEIIFGYKTPLKINGLETIKVLDEIHKCKIGIEKGRDVRNGLKETFTMITYPYNLYLWLLNSSVVSNRDSLFYKKGQDILDFRKQRQFAMLYGEVFEATNKMVNWEYQTDSLGFLSVNNEYKLNNCRVNVENTLNIKLFNTGLSPIKIEEIDLGCDCLTLRDIQDSIIEVNEGMELKVQFLPKSLSDTVKNIFIISDAFNYIEHIEVIAELKTD